MSEVEESSLASVPVAAHQLRFLGERIARQASLAYRLTQSLLIALYLRDFIELHCMSECLEL